jgi:hypothetical protein
MEAQNKSSNIVEKEKPERIRKSGAKKDQRLKVSTEDEDSEASEAAYSDLTESEEELLDPPLPHKIGLPDSQTLTSQELEKEATLEELARSLRSSGLSEEEIEEHLQALANSSFKPEQSESEEPPQGDRSLEELEEELAISLLEAGVPDEDIENMIQGIFHHAAQSEPSPPFSAPGEDQVPTGQ